MKSHDIELCGSTLAIVLQKVDKSNINFDGELIFKQLVHENSKCLWKPELVKSVSLLRYSGNLLDPFTILMRGSSHDLRIIREAWSIRVLRPPTGFHIQIVGDVNRIRAHPLSRGHFIPLREAICVAIGNITSQNSTATQVAILREIADTFGDGVSTAHVPSQELLHETLGRLIKDRVVVCTGDGYHIVRSETYCYLNKPKRSSPSKRVRKKCCCSRCSNSADAQNANHCARKRSHGSELTVRNPNHESVNLNRTMPNIKLSEPKHSSKTSLQTQTHLQTSHDAKQAQDRSIVDKFAHALFRKHRDDRRRQQVSTGHEEPCSLENQLITYEEALFWRYTKDKYNEPDSIKQRSMSSEASKKHSQDGSRKHKKPTEAAQKLHNPDHYRVQHNQLHGTVVQAHNQMPEVPSSHRKKAHGLQRSKSLKLPREKQHEVAPNISETPCVRHYSSEEPSLKNHQRSSLSSFEKRRTSVASSTKQEYSYLHASPNAPAYRIGSAIADYLVESKKLTDSHANPQPKFVKKYPFHKPNIKHEKDVIEGEPSLQGEMKSLTISEPSDDYDTKMAVSLAKQLAKLGVMMTREEWRNYFTVKELPNYVWNKLKSQAPSPVESSKTYFEEAGSLETVIDCGKKMSTQTPETKNVKDLDTMTEDSGFNSSREAGSAVSQSNYHTNRGSMV